MGFYLYLTVSWLLETCCMPGSGGVTGGYHSSWSPDEVLIVTQGC